MLNPFCPISHSHSQYFAIEGLQTPDPLIIRPLHKSRQEKSKYWQLKLFSSSFFLDFSFAIHLQLCWTLLVLSLSLYIYRKSPRQSPRQFPCLNATCNYSTTMAALVTIAEGFVIGNTERNILYSYPFIIFDLLHSLVAIYCGTPRNIAETHLVECPHCGSAIGMGLAVYLSYCFVAQHLWVPASLPVPCLLLILFLSLSTNELLWPMPHAFSLWALCNSSWNY